VKEDAVTFPPGWQSPISASPGQVQKGVDARLLLPSRIDLEQGRLDLQSALRQAGTPRSTPIRVTTEGVIWDGHHAVRLAAEKGETVDVRVIPLLVPPSGLTILQLPVR
jgi:hypothetical protein